MMNVSLNLFKSCVFSPNSKKVIIFTVKQQKVAKIAITIIVCLGLLLAPFILMFGLLYAGVGH